MSNKLPIEIRALEVLKTYNGTNDYILYIKKSYEKNSSGSLTTNQANYIIKNANVNPTIVNSAFILHKSIRNYLKDLYKLDYIPEKLYINKLLSRKGTQLHLWASFGDKPGLLYSIFLEKNYISKPYQLPDISFDHYERNPHKHQVEAIKLLLSNDKFILADDMGLGKTTSAIIAAIEKGCKKILVVCPASLKLNWKYEIMNYDDESNISVVDGSGFVSKKWTIINYDILKNYHFIKEKDQKPEDVPDSIINFYDYDLVIADEAHYLKNSTSNRTKLFCDFAQKIPIRWFLTGTPITNKPIDFYSLLSLCDSPLANNWVNYVKRYCAGKQFNKKGTKGGKANNKFWIVDGSSNLEELREFTSDIILRRTKKGSVDLPQKTVKPIYLPLHTSTAYNNFIEEYERWVEEQAELGIKPKITEHLTKLSKVRQLLAQDKVKETIAIAEELIENGKKVIIFSCFTNSLREIYEHFGKEAVLIDGSISTNKRQEAVNKFQNNDKIKVFCGNIIAAGVGLTLTEGSVVIFNDLDWVPANHSQAEDRAYRIGQTQDVHIIYMLVTETIDMAIFKSLRNKMKVINTVMGDTLPDDVSITEDVVNSILNKNV